MNTIINDDFSSVTTSEDGLREMVLPAHDPVNPAVKFISEGQATALVAKYQGIAAYWSDIKPPTYVNMKFNSFVFYVKTAGGMTATKAMEILIDSEVDEIRLIRQLLLTPGVLIHRDSAEVAMGLDVLIALNYIDEDGKAAILEHWPKA